jgi:3-oxoacyl-[acyl-carrier-protein] synthase III
MVHVAAENCFQASACSRSDIDLLIYAGVYRDDFICEPAIASMVAGTLQINDTIQSQQDKKSFSFDLFNGAVGFLNACYVATSMIQAHKASNAMVVASEVENNLDILPAELRGIEETGSVAILDESPDGKTGFGNFVFKHFPEYMGALASYTKFYKGRVCLHFEKDPDLEAYYQQCITDTVHELLSIEQLDLSQIKVILPPQVSAGFIDRLSDTLKLSRDRFVDVHASHDLFTSSLPYTLQHIREHVMVKPGDIGLIIAVGAGIQVGCATYYF